MNCEALSGDHGTVVPPVPISNTEVKRCCADDSMAIGHAKVGRCQIKIHPVLPSKVMRGFFVPVIGDYFAKRSVGNTGYRWRTVSNHASTLAKQGPVQLDFGTAARLALA